MARPPRSRAGFSLLELVAVVLILGMIGTMVMTSWDAVLPNTRLSAAVRALSEVLRGTRSQAISQNATFRIYYDLDAERYWVETPFRAGGGLAQEEDERVLTDETNLDEWGLELLQITIDDTTYHDGVVFVRFDPLGASSDHTIVLHQPLYERVFTLEVLPLTGEIRFHEDRLFAREAPDQNDFQ